MESSWVDLLIGLLLWGLCVQPSFSFPPKHFPQHAPFPGPHHGGGQKTPIEEPELLNTVKVNCHADTLEVLIVADMFGVGAPVGAHELRLGVEHSDDCTARENSEEEYAIYVQLGDCGTKHWMTEDSLVYTNLLIYSPAASPDGVIRMDEAVIPIECHYERKYHLSSSSLTPTWIPFTSTQTAEEALTFDLRIMTNDWLYERSSNIFYIGDSIGIEASVRVGHHIRLRVFLGSCVATLEPDTNSSPRYSFIENGCLIDSQVPGSESQFFPRTQDDKLYLLLDAFRFHNEDRGQLYITCRLEAVLVNDAEALNKACTFVNGRWKSADGNDYLCGHCQSHSVVGQSPTKPTSLGKFGPRGFGNVGEPEASWRIGQPAVWQQEAKVGPVLVLPAESRVGPSPVEELPTALSKKRTPAFHGSQWRSGINNMEDLKKNLPSAPPTSEEMEVQAPASQDQGVESTADLNDEASLITSQLTESNTTAADSEASLTTLFTEDPMPFNLTASESVETNNPK